MATVFKLNAIAAASIAAVSGVSADNILRVNGIDWLAGGGGGGGDGEGVPGFWDPANKTASVVLSNSNRTATMPAASSNMSVRSVDQRGGGKWYVELLWEDRGDAHNANFVGFSAANGGSADVGTDSARLNHDGTVYHGTGATGTATGNNRGISIADNDIIRMAIDLDAKKVWFAVNDEAWLGGGDPGAGTSASATYINGFALATVHSHYQDLASTPKVVTLPTSFTYDVPTGFTGSDVEIFFEELLLHMDGTDASPTFIDSGIHGYTITAHGNAQIDTAQWKFGGASGLFDGTGDYLTATMAAFDYGANVLTIDFWARFAAAPGDSCIWVFEDDKFWCIISGGRMYVGGPGTLFNPLIDQTTGVWHHFALVHTGGETPNWSLYQNGTRIGNTADVLTTGSLSNITIGYRSAEGWYFNGHIEEFRIRRNEAVWTGTSFTPPTEPYLGSDSPSSVLLLLNFEHADGSTTPTDGSNYAWPLHTITALEVDTSAKKWGNASLMANSGSNAELRYTISYPVTQESNFCMQGWFYFPSGFSSHCTLMTAGWAGQDNVFCLFNADDTSPDFRRINAIVNGVTVASSPDTSGVNVFPQDTWVLLEMQYIGATQVATIYLNGLEIASGTYSGSDFAVPLSEARILRNSALTGVRVDSIRYTAAMVLLDEHYPISAPFTNDVDDDPCAHGPTGSNGTWSSVNKTAGWVLSGGDLIATESTGSGENIMATTGMMTGKVYWEVTFTAASGFDAIVGIRRTDTSVSTGYTSGQTCVFRSGGTNFYAGSSGATISTTGATAFVSGDVMGIAVDFDAEKMWISKNGVWFNGDPTSGTGEQFSGFDASQLWYPFAAWDNVAGTHVATLNMGATETEHCFPQGFFAPLGTQVIRWLTKAGDSSAWTIIDDGKAATSADFNGYVHTDAQTTGKLFVVIADESDSVTAGNVGFAFSPTNTYPATTYAIAFNNGGGEVANWSLGAFGGAYGTGDYLCIALDVDAGKGWIGKNNVFSGNPAGGTGNNLTFTPGGPIYIFGNRNNNGTGANTFRFPDISPYSPPYGFSLWGAFVNTAPTITSNGGGGTASISVAENTTAVTTVTATDPDAGQTLTYSISGGADAADFSINSSSGVLTFSSAPNYEAPADADTNNVYHVTVQVSDGHGGTDTQAIDVTVTDVDESTPTLTSATINSAGTSISLLFSTSVSIGAGSSNGFVPTLSGGTATMSYSSGSASTTLVYSLSRTVGSDETGTLAYTQPGNGIENSIGGADVATFSGATITNNSTVGEGDLNPIDAERRTDWTFAGTPIPVGWTQSGSTIAAYSGTSGTIHTALAAAADNTYVLLGAGTFTLSTALNVAQKNNVILRGSAGTIITFTNDTGSDWAWGGSSCPLTICGDPVWNGDATPTIGGAPAAGINISGTDGDAGVYAQGATVLNLASTPTGWAVGEVVAITQNDPSDGSLPAAGFFVTDKTDGSGTDGISWQGAYDDHGAALIQRSVITAISGNDVTISPPLAHGRWTSGLTPRAYRITGCARNVGIENLRVVTTSLGAHNAVIGIARARDCWIKGVALVPKKTSFHAGGAVDFGFGIIDSTRIAVVNCWVDPMIGGGIYTTTSYGISTKGSSFVLCENNIFKNPESPIVVNIGTVGSVFAYNFENYVGDDSQESGIIMHEVGSVYNLFEGNRVNKMNADAFHGNTMVNTCYRNYMESRGFDLWAYHRFYNVVGNVINATTVRKTLSTDGTKYNRWSSYGFRLGYNCQEASVDPDFNAPSLVGVDHDPDVATTTMLWGNYTVTGGSVFNSAEVPSSDPTLPNPVPANNDLPASQFRSSIPAYFTVSGVGTQPWPLCGPDVTGGNYLGGRAYKTPAQLVYEAASGNVANFDPTLYGVELRWSDPDSWGGSLPTGSDDVEIPVGDIYLWDTASAVCRDLTINGTLRVDPTTNPVLTCASITIGPTGLLEVGTASVRYTGSARITLNGPLSSAATTNRYAVDQTGSSGAGNGVLTKLAEGSGASANETITVTWSSATAFSVSGSVSGSLGSGTNGVLFNNKVRFIAVAGGTAWANGHTRTLSIERLGSKNSGMQRGIMVNGGQIVMHGVVKTSRTRIGASIAASASSFTLATAPSNWLAGDELGLGGSDLRTVGSGQPQKVTLASNVTGTTASITGTVTSSRYGVLQYATDAGPSLTADTITRPSDYPLDDWNATPKVLDERAPVINLTRGIVIESVNDSDWSTSGFGAHVMAMGEDVTVQIDSVEFRRVGQRALGRYPMHWHMCSYSTTDGSTLPSDGTFLSAVSNNYLRNSSINRSTNRAWTIHGTHGAEISDNVAYDIEGHAFLMEDGSEEDNVIQRNVVMKVRTVPTTTDALLRSDLVSPASGQSGGAAGYWLSNPNNDFIDNWAIDCDQWGVINAWAMPRCIGQSQHVAITPSLRPSGTHSGTIVASCGQEVLGGFKTTAGMATGFPHTDNRGTILDRGFDDGARDDLLIEDAQIWKCTRGYYNRVPRAIYRGWTVADNGRIDFVGQSSAVNDVSFGEQILFFAESLNNANSLAASTNKCGVASYHELLFFKNCIAVNYEYSAPSFLSGDAIVPVGRGFVQVNDLYTDPLFTFADFTGLKLIDSVFGAMVRPPHIGDGNPLGSRHYSFGSAIRDVNGTIVGANRTWIIDVPFLTTDVVDLQDADGGEKSTSSRFYGIYPFQSAEPSSFSNRRPIDVRRLDGSYADIPSASGSTWTVGDGASSPYVPFRHFSVMKNGRYRVLWGSDSVTWSVLRVDHAELNTDAFLIAIQHNGGTPSAAFITTNSANTVTAGTPPSNPSGGEISAGEAINLTSVGSIATCASTPNSYFYESGQTRVWVNYLGGLTRSSWPNGDIGERQKSHYIVIK